jgi:hypothetical protein
MTLSIAQLTANRANAQKSTGAITQSGKNRVSQNAIKHGLFSQRLVLNDENPLEYQSLLGELQCCLQPVGILEQSLVERIALSLWRQRRLVKAETAQLELDRQAKRIAKVVEQEMYPQYSVREISEYDLIALDDEHLQHCRAILDEYKSIDTSIPITLADMAIRTPLLYEILQQTAEEKGITPEQYLQNYESPIAYFATIIDDYRGELLQASQKQIILDVAALVKDKRVVLAEKMRDSFSKYQVMLDNELYKAIKALREVQTWRIDMLPTANGQNYSLN